MIYTFTLNPAIDYIIEVNNFKIGDINRSRYETLKAGGKGINVSKALKEIGTESIACGFIAGATGCAIKSELDNLGIKNIFVNVKGISRINVKLISGEETAINGKGCTADLKDMDTLLSLIETSNEDYIVLSGSLCRGLDDNTYAYIMGKLKGRFIVDCEKALLTNTLKLKPFIIKPNNIELGDIFNTSIDSFDKAIYYGKQLCTMGAVNVIVSMGSMGAVFVNNNEEYVINANSIKVKNTVSAGDTMVAGFLHCLVNGKGFKECLEFGAELAERKIACI